MNSKEFTYAINSLIAFSTNHFSTGEYSSIIDKQILQLTVKTGAYLIHNLPESRGEVTLYYDTISKVLDYIEDKEIYDAVEEYNRVFDKMLITLDGK